MGWAGGEEGKVISKSVLNAHLFLLSAITAVIAACWGFCFPGRGGHEKNKPVATSTACLLKRQSMIVVRNATFIMSTYGTPGTWHFTSSSLNTQTSQPTVYTYLDSW